MDNLEILKNIKKSLIQRFPNDIDKVILFGSQVNGAAGEHSDYDILIITKKSYDWKFENEIYDACFDINLKYNVITDIKIVSYDELSTLKGKQPFIQHAIHDGITI